MNEALVALTVVGIITYGIVTIIKLITEYKLKRRLIDKAEVSESLSVALEESMKSVAPKYEQFRYPTLKWGLVFLSAGLGLIALEFFDYDHRSPLPFGILSACIALGFLIYYFQMKREIKKPD